MIVSPDLPVPVYCFTKVANVGDRINLPLISRLFRVQAVLASLTEDHVLAIGSILQLANSGSRIWGTGLLRADLPVNNITPRYVRAVRGKLTYAALRERGIALRDIPLGDPAFLIARLMRRDQQKNYRLGIVAHYVDRGHPWVRRLLADPDVADLNVHEEPDTFLSKMAGCEAVVSSSLHGLIFAEALSIPNVWVKLSDKVLGDGFKFRDWFSLAGSPQVEPEGPGSTDSADDFARKARLHDFRIDAEGLMRSFPLIERRLES